MRQATRGQLSNQVRIILTPKTIETNKNRVKGHCAYNLFWVLCMENVSRYKIPLFDLEGQQRSNGMAITLS